MSDNATITHADRTAGLSHADRAASVSHEVYEWVTQTINARNRIIADGGVIEGGLALNLIDPILRELKANNELSNLVFLGAAGAREVVNGSVATLYDWSGNQNDATQSDSAKRPSDTTDTNFNGRNVLSLDGSDDFLSTSSPSGTSTTTGYSAFNIHEAQSSGSEMQSLRARPLGRFASAEGIAHGYGSSLGWKSPISPIEDESGNAYTLDGFAGPSLSTDDQNLCEFRWVDDAAQGWKNGSKTGSSITVENGSTPLGTMSLSEIVVGASEVSFPSRHWDGLIVCHLIVASPLTDQQHSDIRSIINDYYNIY